MKSYSRPVWIAAVVAGSLAASLAAAPAWAGIVSNPATDPGYVITRIVSQTRLPGATQDGASEVIAPTEAVPQMPVNGETIFYGTSNLAPQAVRASIWNGTAWVDLNPGTDFTFRADILLVGPGNPADTNPANRPPMPFTQTYSVVFRFPADKVSLIQNHWTRFQIAPPPAANTGGGPSPVGSNGAVLYVRSPQSAPTVPPAPTGSF